MVILNNLVYCFLILHKVMIILSDIYQMLLYFNFDLKVL